MSKKSQKALKLEIYFPKLDKLGRPVIETETLDKVIPASPRLAITRARKAVSGSAS